MSDVRGRRRQRRQWQKERKGDRYKYKGRTEWVEEEQKRQRFDRKAYRLD